MTDHDVGMLHADIQRLREQSQRWLMWLGGTFGVILIVGLIGVGSTLARLENVEAQARETRQTAAGMESRVGHLERSRDVMVERLDNIRASIEALSREVRNAISRDDDGGARP